MDQSARRIERCGPRAAMSRASWPWCEPSGHSSCGPPSPSPSPWSVPCPLRRRRCPRNPAGATRSAVSRCVHFIAGPTPTPPARIGASTWPPAPVSRCGAPARDGSPSLEWWPAARWSPWPAAVGAPPTSRSSGRWSRRTSAWTRDASSALWGMTTPTPDCTWASGGPIGGSATSIPGSCSPAPAPETGRKRFRRRDGARRAASASGFLALSTGASPVSLRPPSLTRTVAWPRR